MAVKLTVVVKCQVIDKLIIIIITSKLIDSVTVTYTNVVAASQLVDCDFDLVENSILFPSILERNLHMQSLNKAILREQVRSET